MLLLDTHTYLWFINDDNKLSRDVKKYIEDTSDVYVSVVTFWEIAIKYALGKLQLPCPPSVLMTECEKIKIGILPITAEHIETLGNIPLIHRDPFDRMLISQAMAEDMTLVTADKNIHMYDCVRQIEI
ncbi:MAG: type II toxin-antitoxin system VapC family toxin [Oscillospiraceae bacterium]|nr:type II toxin-antitoxin system VapC family toxin [Oscillospiraceae bacterium]